MNTSYISSRAGIYKLIAVVAVSLMAVLAFGLKQAHAVSTPPDTFIYYSKAQDSTMQLYFGSDQTAPLPKYQCKLDDGPWKSCSPGITWHGLAGTYANPLTHSIQVRAVNSDGTVDPTPDTVTAVTPRTPIGVAYSAGVGDACRAFATGIPGMNLTVDASSDGKGGSYTYVIPDSGTLMWAGTGATKGMIVQATLTDALGNVYATGRNVVTADVCPPAGQ